MVKRNAHFAALQPNYLFHEIRMRRQRFLEHHPNADLINLGIGDTTQPIPAGVVQKLSAAAEDLGDIEKYTGYGPETGFSHLRALIAQELYPKHISADDIFIGDGAKCDIGRLQLLFGPNVSIGVQDPTYPVYVDGSLLHGVKKIIPLPCTPENDFFPDLGNGPDMDLLYFCSPNNPTSAVATREQLKTLVNFARKKGTVIIFDASYSGFIVDENLPRTIYEIEGADEVAIEVNSFSKLAGFCGLRLGWTIVPESLCFDDGSSIKADWIRLMTTIFNGASNIVQHGGHAALDARNFAQLKQTLRYYLDNASLIRKQLTRCGYTVYGGVNAPYLWAHAPGRRSWDLFEEFLNKYQIITTPGVGFGPSGEGFLRLSSFALREQIERAMQRIDATL